jgi:Protein of unknown function (DUF3572)
MNTPLSHEMAEAVALQALTHIAADEDLLGAFLAQTGLAADELKTQATDPALLGGVLDFLMSDEAGLVAFCEAAQMEPEMPGLARRSLPGGEEVHWT